VNGVIKEGSTSGGQQVRSRFVWLALIAGAVIGCSLILLGLRVIGGFGETAALRAEVTRSYETRAELQRILSLHQDVETGQRGFVLTGDRRFLEPYEGAGRQIDSSFQRLESQWLAGSPLLGEVQRLRQASTLKRRFSEETVALTLRGRVAEARERIAGGAGKQAMDAIRGFIERIDRDERTQLADRTQRAEEARRRLQWQTLVLLAALLILLAVAILYLVRTYKSWRRTLLRGRDLSARQEAIFDAGSDGMIIINASGSIESLNPAAARMFGYEPGELLRRDVGNLFEVAPDRGRVETFLKRLAGRRAGTSGDRQEFVGRCRDGTLFPAEVSVSPVQLRDKMLFLAVLRDVTERKQVDRMKTEFVSTVSHELRTPLTSIAGSLGLITGGAAGELPSRARRLIEIAQSNCARLIRLINDILDIEKIESGRMQFDIQTLPLSRLLEQAAQANRGFAAEHGVMIHVHPVPANSCILGDEDRVMQVLTNLLSNAAKFSPRGGVVEMSVRALDRRYRISVADQGPGIPEDFQGRIFTKFAQADSSDTRQKGGTGLGLSIVREIVDRLGGTVSFESAPGEGTVFHVDLPASGQCDGADEGAAGLAPLADTNLPVVLHVDDDPDMLRIVASALEGRAQVHSTPSVVEARASIMRYAFDAVVLDIGMADGDGLELVPLIRDRQDARIIVFTAQDADPGRLRGADLALVKSRDSLERLADGVEALIRRREQEGAA
jgi:PAS domain S-box-containing protein